MSVLALDIEAVQALVDPHHAQHSRVLAHLESAVARHKRGDLARVEVPCAARVEAGWDRSADAVCHQAVPGH